MLKLILNGIKDETRFDMEWKQKKKRNKQTRNETKEN